MMMDAASFFYGELAGAAITLVWSLGRIKEWKRAGVSACKGLMLKYEQPRSKNGRFISHTTLMTEQLKGEVAQYHYNKAMTDQYAARSELTHE